MHTQEHMSTPRTTTCLSPSHQSPTASGSTPHPRVRTQMSGRILLPQPRANERESSCDWGGGPRTTAQSPRHRFQAAEWPSHPTHFVPQRLHYKALDKFAGQGSKLNAKCDASCSRKHGWACWKGYEEAAVQQRRHFTRLPVHKALWGIPIATAAAHHPPIRKPQSEQSYSHTGGKGNGCANALHH